MKSVWVFVEGKSDAGALSVLWADWKQKLGNTGWRLRIVPLANKSKYLANIGIRAADKLVSNVNDLVVGLPDLYPNQDFVNTKFRHSNLHELQNLQIQLVKLEVEQMVVTVEVGTCMERFFASALKHDLEMLLLAVPGQLRNRLKTSASSIDWPRRPEDQNQNKPPKKIVEKLFRTRLKRSYREITDSQAILSKATLSEVLFDEKQNVKCPAFRAMLDWIGTKTQVPAY